MLIPEREKEKILEFVQREDGFEVLKESPDSDMLNRRKGKVVMYE